jgi:hypothetical protein
MDELAAGWDELRRGRWDAARAIFEDATADGKSAEALEGLSWAGRDDAGVAVRSRDRAQRFTRGWESGCRRSSRLSADRDDGDVVA